MRSIVTTLALLVLSQAASAATLHVPADYPTIGSATALAVSGDTVLVAAGTYHERFTLGPGQGGVKIYSESGPAVTIIDGGYTGSVVSMTQVGLGTELVGFTIMHGGHSPRLATDFGAGMNLDRSSPKIVNDIISQNSSFSGAVYSTQGSPVITACVFDGNKGSGGVGIYVGSGSATIHGDTFTNNQAEAGGAIYVDWDASADIAECVFRDNQVGMTGGGIYAHGLVVITNNQFFTNSASDAGGGVYLSTTTSSVVRGNLFQQNSAVNTGGGLDMDHCTSALVEKNQFLRNLGGGAAVYLLRSTTTIRENLIQDNECPHGTGGGIYVDRFSSASIIKNEILRNHAVAWGGGITVWLSTAVITNNTLALNRGDMGGGNIYLRRGSSVTIQQNICSLSPNDGIDNDLIDGDNTYTFSCNDVSNNAGGNYTGLADPTGKSGNISSDPLFCDLQALDVHLSMASPCAAAHAPAGCGLMGALDVGCAGPVPVEPTTWGGLKARYR